MKRIIRVGLFAALMPAAFCAGCTQTKDLEYKVADSGSWLAVSPESPVVTVVAKSMDGQAAKSTLRFIVAPDKCKGFGGTDGGYFSYEMLPPVIDKTLSVKVSGDSSVVAFTAELPGPGFYQCLVIGNGKDTVRHFTIGLDPEKIISPADAQPDFKEFWDAAKKELSQVDPQYELTLLPDSSSAARNIYMVTMRSLGGERIAGFYAVPTTGGKHPAIVNYMGYGSKPWCFNPGHNPGWAEFVLSVRGQGLNEPDNKYGDWITYGLDNKDHYYYRGAFMDLVRAVDFLSSRDEIDHNLIFAEGGSQGGAFTLAACALDPRIKAGAPTIPFLSDYPDYFQIVHWPAEPVVRKQKELGLTDEELYRTLSYFDIKNFAGQIGCPILMGFGLQDKVCPPHTNFASYNLIASQKQYVCYPQSGHDTGPDWWNRRMDFFNGVKEQLNGTEQRK